MSLAPGPSWQLLEAVHQQPQHIWDMQVHLTLKHYGILFGCVWVARSMFANWWEDHRERSDPLSQQRKRSHHWVDQHVWRANRGSK